jgi:predicted membrane protein
MYELLKLFLNICLLKQGPQDIPGSNTVLSLVMPVYVIINFLILILSSDVSIALLQVITESILILTLSWIILFFFKKSPRYSQTVCALVGTDAVISFFALPVMSILLGQGSQFAFFTLIVLMIWHWAVTGHIFSMALDKPLSFGLGISFLYILASNLCMTMIFPNVILTE